MSDEENYKKNSSFNGIPYDKLSPQHKRYIDAKAKEFKDVTWNGNIEGWKSFPQEDNQCRNSSPPFLQMFILAGAIFLLFKACS